MASQWEGSISAGNEEFRQHTASEHQSTAPTVTYKLDVACIICNE